MYFLLWTKGSHESSNFDTFKCSGKNLPNSSCHFPDHKSVFLRILHDSLVSSKIIPLYFFSWSFIYLHERDQSKCKVLKLLSARNQNWLSKPFKVSAKKVQKIYLSWYRRVTQNLKKNWLVVWNMTWGNWRIFLLPLKTPETSLRPWNYNMNRNNM